MPNMYVSTVRISNERAISPVVYRRAQSGKVLAPEHHVVWSLFDRDEIERNWLYRRLTERSLRLVSSKAPTSSPYATVVATREQSYDWLQTGMRLVFRLRANAVQRVIVGGKTRKVDVVMHGLHPLSPERSRNPHTWVGCRGRVRHTASQWSMRPSKLWRTTGSAFHGAMLRQLSSTAPSWLAC